MTEERHHRPAQTHKFAHACLHGWPPAGEHVCAEALVLPRHCAPTEPKMLKERMLLEFSRFSISILIEIEVKNRLAHLGALDT